jgi:hypothetical protein
LDERWLMGTAMRDDKLTAKFEMPGSGRAGLESCEVIQVGDFVNNNREWSKQLA